MSGVSSQDLLLILPEVTLVGTILALVLGDMLLATSDKKLRTLSAIAIGGLLLSGGFATCHVGAAPLSAFYDQVAVDSLGSIFKLLFMAVSIVAVITGRLSQELPTKTMGEYLILLVSITLGMNLMASANDLLMVYLAIEFVSIVSYAMAGFRQRDRRSSEAALKYVIYGGAASGLMIFGISLFYGMFGTTELGALNHAMVGWSQVFFKETMGSTTAFPLTLMVSIIMMFAGIAYKIAVVPFHMWSPDVYEGAPTPFTGFLSVGPKAAGFALLIRVFIGLFAVADTATGGTDGGALGYALGADGVMRMIIDLPIAVLLGVIAAATMTLGNLAAIAQTNVKRLLAYSSIAHAGYLLMGFVVLSPQSLHAIIFYLIIYYMMNMGAFLIVQVVRDRTGGEMISDFRGLGERSPWLAICMSVFLLSLTGMPPFAGFIGKFYIFASVLERGGFWLMVLAVVGVLNSAVSLYYYMQIVRSMWFATPLKGYDSPFENTTSYSILATVLALPLLILGLYWSPLSGVLKGSLGVYRSPAAMAAISLVGPDTTMSKKQAAKNRDAQQVIVEAAARQAAKAQTAATRVLQAHSPAAQRFRQLQKMRTIRRSAIVGAATPTTTPATTPTKPIQAIQH